MSVKKLTLFEVTITTGVTPDRVEYFVHNEWISPIGPGEFDDEDLARIKLIRDLQKDFGANEESVPIILHLVDQIHCLQKALMESKGSDGGS